MTTWTEPRTYVHGELITKAMLDQHVRDNLIFLKRGVDVTTLRYTPGSAYNAFFAAASNTFVNVDTTNLRLTVTKGNPAVDSFLMVGVRAIISNVQSRAHYALNMTDSATNQTRLGDSTYGGYQRATTGTPQPQWVPMHFFHVLDNVADDTYTFDLQWGNFDPASSDTLYLKDEEVHMYAIEYLRG